MVNTYVKTIYLAVISCCIFQLSGFAQQDNSETNFYAEADFKGFQIDASTLIFVNSLCVAADFDFIKNKRTPSLSFGVRTGADYYGILGDVVVGEPGNTALLSATVEFFDVNICPRFTADFKRIRLDLYAGGTYHSVIKPENKTSEVKTKDGKMFFKGGLDLKVKLYGNYFGLLGKIVLSSGESFGGLGIFAGYGKEY
ncbi:MAG: hypothetical protein JW917_00180 [Ignavibacteria bacterium]|nr:hypothetical protein [Ignavibacteria bacterium]